MFVTGRFSACAANRYREVVSIEGLDAIPRTIASAIRPTNDSLAPLEKDHLRTRAKLKVKNGGMACIELMHY